MTVPDRQLLTDALIAMLASGTGKAVGDHKAPTQPEVDWAEGERPPPYLVVFTVPGGGYWGPAFVAPESNADFVYQVDSVGFQRKQVEWLADRVRRTVLARSSTGAFQVSLVAPVGWRVADRLPDGGAGGVDVQGVPPHEVFSIPERFVLRVVAA